MRIEVVGRNVEVTDELREHIHKRFHPIARQVSELARLDIVIWEETNPAIRNCHGAEATLYLKGTTLHAEECEETMGKAVHHLSSDMKRQVKRHRELRRKRSTTRRLVAEMRGQPAELGR